MIEPVVIGPPDGYVTLVDYCERRGIDSDVASRAARQGRIAGAVQVRLAGSPGPVWFVPASCRWRPNRVGEHVKRGG